MTGLLLQLIEYIMHVAEYIKIEIDFLRLMAVYLKCWQVVNNL